MNMIVSFHLVAFLVHEYFTPEWQRRVRDITREVVEVFEEKSDTKRGKKRASTRAKNKQLIAQDMFTFFLTREYW